MLIVKQVQGIWSCKSDKLALKLREVKVLLRKIRHCQIHYVGRAKNQDADALASVCLKEAMIGAIKLQEPKLQGKECLQDVLNFLETGEPPSGLTKGERRWLARKAVRYRLIKDDLFCLGKDQILRKVPPSGDIHRILHSCHNDVCGGHFAQDITCRKVLQAGFVWPSLQRDAKFWCKTCDMCQHSGPRRLVHGPQQPIASFGPFEKWGIDAIGPLPRTAARKEYIIMGVDYMTRWQKLHQQAGSQPRMWLNLCLIAFVAGLVHLLKSFQIEDLGLEGT